MKNKVNIHIGEFYASREPAVIYTLLGSCVAVCLFDPHKMIGGMNHILLPGRPNLSRFDHSARYGINAMELLINRIMNLGGNKCEIVAKVFGGAHVIPAISPANSVGPRIAEFVKLFLEKEEIRIISRDLGGDSIRRVYFHTDTGEAFVKRIPSMNYQNISKMEKEYFRRIKKESVKTDNIEIFSE